MPVAMARVEHLRRFRASVHNEVAKHSQARAGGIFALTLSLTVKPARSRIGRQASEI
jgi:hypothetical protein